MGSELATLEDLLGAIPGRKIPPTRFWRGDTGQSSRAQFDVKVCARFAVEKLFGFCRPGEEVSYEIVSPEIGINLIGHALMGPGFLSVLSWIGGQHGYGPPISVAFAEKLTSILLHQPDDWTCIVNVNDTGAWSSVDPNPPADLFELLVVFSSVTHLIAVYWGKAID